MSFNFTGVGRISPITKETDKFKAVEVKRFKSGWCVKTLNFNFSYGTFRSLMQVQFGYRGDANGNIIPGDSPVYTSKLIENEDGTKGSENVKIPYESRFDEEEIADVPKSKKFYVDTNNVNMYAVENVCAKFNRGEQISETDMQKYEIYSTEDANELLHKVHKKHKEYICIGDFLDNLEKVLKTPDIGKKKFRVRGTWEWKFSDTKQIFYKTFRPTSVSLIEDEKQSDAVEEMLLNYDFIFNNGAYDDKNYKEIGKVFINGYTKLYDSQYKEDDCKGKVFAPVTMSFAPENDQQYEVIKKRFSVLTGSKYKLMRIDANYVEGAERTTVTFDDLSEEIKEEINLGLRQLDVEIQKAGGTKFGDKITEIRYKDWDGKFGIQDTEYEDSDLGLPVHTSNESEAKQTVNNVINSSDNADEDIFDI